MTYSSAIFWALIAFSVGMVVGPFCLLPFVPKGQRKEVLQLMLRPWRPLKKPERMFPEDGGERLKKNGGPIRWK